MVGKFVFPSYQINCDKTNGDCTLQGSRWVLFDLVLGFIGAGKSKMFGKRFKVMHIFLWTGISFEDEFFGIVGRCCGSKGRTRGSTIAGCSIVSSGNGRHCAGPFEW